MLGNDIIVRRLALVKHLYRVGLEQSRQSETLAAFSILSFHDSVEMFLRLLAEHKDVNSDNFGFLNYWEKFPDLTLKESLRNLNTRRVNIKHKGLLPSKADIEISRVNTIDFFEQNTFKQFGIEFKDISLLSLIQNTIVRQPLEEAQVALGIKNERECIDKSAIAFEVLLHTYQNNKTKYFGKSPFFFGQDLTFNSSFVMKVTDSKMAQFVDKVKESIEAIRDAIEIISFGIDYKRFVKFKLLTPQVRIMPNQVYVGEISGKRKWTVENCQYCIDFVLDCAMKLQEFDFDIAELQEIKSPYPVVTWTKPSEEKSGSTAPDKS